MFQYAAARALSTRLATNLYIDCSFLMDAQLGRNIAKREYGLESFSIHADEVILSRLTEFKQRALLWKRLRINSLNKHIFRNKLPFSKIYGERKRSYDQHFMSLSKNTLLAGYWQSPRYFKGYENLIRNDFTFKNAPPPSNAAYLKSILQAENAVAVHVRRGDFGNIHILGFTELDYYRKAIAYMVGALSRPVFYFFSDDMDWTKAVFQFVTEEHDTTFVNARRDGRHDTEDIRLMSACDHQIVGNSTFAWWGAWLAANPNKVVIAPKRLFVDMTLDQELQDMIPYSWVRL